MPDTLIARLESAGEGSRELDAHLFAMAQGGRIHWIDPVDGDLVWEKPIDGMWIRHPSSLRKMPAYTTSLDAAIALVARLLPEMRVENLCEWDHSVLRARGPWMCDLVERGKDGMTPGALKAKCANAPTPALALVIAVLRALEARDNRP